MKESKIKDFTEFGNYAYRDSSVKSQFEIILKQNLLKLTLS